MIGLVRDDIADLILPWNILGGEGAMYAFHPFGGGNIQPGDIPMGDGRGEYRCIQCALRYREVIQELRLAPDVEFGIDIFYSHGGHADLIFRWNLSS